MNLLASLEPKDWITIAAALVAATAAIIAAIVTSLTARKTNKETIKNLKERRYMDAIITQRIKWLDQVREVYIEFNTFCDDFLINSIINKGKTEKEFMSEQIKKGLEMRKYINKVNLLSNSNEIWFKKLTIQLDKIKDYLLDDYDHKKNNEEYYELVYDNLFIQKSILKTEWKRIQKEIEYGEKLSSNQVEKIFSETANSINEEKYKQIFK